MMAKGKSARMGQGDRNSNETLFGSLEHFNLENKYIGAAIIDNNINPWRECSTGWFDAIITDPPYGVREKCEKVEGCKIQSRAILICIIPRKNSAEQAGRNCEIDEKNFFRI